MSDSFRPHGLQRARLPCPSPSPGVYSNSLSPLSQCHPAVSSSVVPLLLTSIFTSIRVFYNESALRMRWPKYWSVLNPAGVQTGPPPSRRVGLNLVNRILPSRTICSYPPTKVLTHPESICQERNANFPLENQW